MSQQDRAGRYRDELAAEARRAAADPADRAEMRAVMEDMDAVAADWPVDDADTDEGRAPQQSRRG